MEMEMCIMSLRSSLQFQSYSSEQNTGFYGETPIDKIHIVIITSTSHPARVT